MPGVPGQQWQRSWTVSKEQERSPEPLRQGTSVEARGGINGTFVWPGSEEHMAQARSVPPDPSAPSFPGVAAPVHGPCPSSQRGEPAWFQPIPGLPSPPFRRISPRNFPGPGPSPPPALLRVAFTDPECAGGSLRPGAWPSGPRETDQVNRGWEGLVSQGRGSPFFPGAGTPGRRLHWLGREPPPPSLQSCLWLRSWQDEESRLTAGCPPCFAPWPLASPLLWPVVTPPLGSCQTSGEG